MAKQRPRHPESHRGLLKTAYAGATGRPMSHTAVPKTARRRRQSPKAEQNRPKTANIACKGRPSAAKVAYTGPKSGPGFSCPMEG